jgi:hypothetical protein
VLDAIEAKFQNDASFQLVFITFEKENLNELAAEHKFQVAYVNGQKEALKMNYHNPFPSYVLVNKAGVVVDVSGLKVPNAVEITEKIKTFL